MKIKELYNTDLKVNKVAMMCDKIIKDSKGKSIANPLMNTSHFYIITGASGSGKTNLLINLLKSNKQTKDKKHKLSYRKMFDKILFVSPSSQTISDSPLEKIDDSQKFTELSDEVFEMIEEISDEAIDENKHNLLILDDVSSQLRMKENEKRLNQIIKNRRHKNLSIWIIGHRIVDFGTGLRTNANMIYAFTPKTNKEIDTLQTEYMLMSKKQAEEIFRACFKSRYDFLLIDASLRNSAKFEFYRNFNKLVFDETDNDK